MDATLVIQITFLAASLAVIAVASLASDIFLRERSRVRSRLQDEFRSSIESRGKRSALFKDLSLMHSEATQQLPGTRQRIEALLQQSGTGITLKGLVTVSIACAVLCGIVSAALTRLWLVWPAATLCGLAAPAAYVWLKRKARVNKLCAQLPESFELMSRAVRAGQTMSHAMQLIATQSRPPISEEFAYCCEQQNLGLPQEVTLPELAKRTGVVELQMFVVAMLVQRQAGGNPVDVLNNLSDIIRKRTRLWGRVKALTSEGRMQAVVLSCLPLVALGALFVLNRSYAQVLLERPYLLVGILVSELLGTLWIRRIVNFSY